MTEAEKQDKIGFNITKKDGESTWTTAGLPVWNPENSAVFSDENGAVRAVCAAS